MDGPSGWNDIEHFVLKLLCTGYVLAELVADLVDELPADAFPGEEPTAVVVEMLCGTIATALVSVDPHDVRRATELIEVAAARTREHLQLACDLSRRIDGDDDGRSGRTYG
jgi:hypothetical protein